MANLNAQMLLSQQGSKRKRTTIYTHWGKSKCNDESDIHTVYSGQLTALLFALFTEPDVNPHRPQFQASYFHKW